MFGASELMQPKEVACWAPGSFSPIRKIKIHIVSRLFECYSLFIFRVSGTFPELEVYGVLKNT